MALATMATAPTLTFTNKHAYNSRHRTTSKAYIPVARGVSMKKSTKLTIKKVTLRHLEDASLDNLAGGALTSANTCASTCPVKCTAIKTVCNQTACNLC
jgi:hypothetical protein